MLFVLEGVIFIGGIIISIKNILKNDIFIKEKKINTNKNKNQNNIKI